MELIDQHTKRIMEGCKKRARDEGLSFEDETLEYIVSNRDLLELSPKIMIPTLYDYWVHDVEVLKEKGKYELYPSNPYETVINTRPPISFYNDNNPDWLNVMIFYHVLGHIDFFQNNLYFRHTWDLDFTGQALADKRLISQYRSEKGRWVDYLIEFSRSIDNLVGYFEELTRLSQPPRSVKTKKLDYYFDQFLQTEKKISIGDYIKEVERYNEYRNTYDSLGEATFFHDVEKKYPEFDALFKKHLEKKQRRTVDLLQYLMEHSEFLNSEENKWMKSIMQVVRKTSLFFQPQVRTKIMNEGWASYWHETLFLKDDRIKGHEVDFARINASVTSMPRVGLNPYAMGMRLFYYLKDMAEKGKYSYKFQKMQNILDRNRFDQATKSGSDFIFNVREHFSDFTFINTFLDQDFMDRHNLFVAGKRLNRDKMVWEYYVKSRKLKDYKEMLINSFYHPPHIIIDPKKNGGNTLYLNHIFEGKPLVKEYIPNTLMGIEYLWGGPVKLETSEVARVAPSRSPQFSAGIVLPSYQETEEKEMKWRRVLYTMKNRRLAKEEIPG